jgi:FkbM family methyltransferase
MYKILKKIQLLLKPQAIKDWLAVDGDKTLRLDYPLDADSVVFDVGGYEGQWASDIYAKSNCTVYVFEPIKAYAERIAKRFAANPRIKVFNIGLAGKTESAKINLSADGSSIYGAGEAQEAIKLKAIDEFWQEENIADVALMKINIEGGEYPLLKRLIEAGLVSKIRSLQIQFHKIAPDSEEERSAIRQELEKTHRLAWNYDFVWENWERI